MTRVAPCSTVVRDDPKSLRADEALRRIALVPQNPADLLYLDSVFAECREADQVADAAPGTTTALLDRLAPVSRALRTPAIFPRVNDLLWCLPSNWPGDRMWCCWTNRRVASTTRQNGDSARFSAS